MHAHCGGIETRELEQTPLICTNFRARTQEKNKMKWNEPVSCRLSEATCKRLPQTKAASWAQVSIYCSESSWCGVIKSPLPSNTNLYITVSPSLGWGSSPEPVGVKIAYKRPYEGAWLNGRPPPESRFIVRLSFLKCENRARHQLLAVAAQGEF